MSNGKAAIETAPTGEYFWKIVDGKPTKRKLFKITEIREPLILEFLTKAGVKKGDLVSQSFLGGLTLWCEDHKRGRI